MILLIILVRQTSVRDETAPVMGQVGLDIPSEFALTKPAVFSGFCQYVGDGLYLVSGTLAFGCNTPCARCLKNSVIDMIIPFEERFAREEKVGSEEDIYTYSGDEINLDLALSEAANMALPLRVLCK
jgi:uncharacterized metal-binding protein YceD (DUF177 family)